MPAGTMDDIEVNEFIVLTGKSSYVPSFTEVTVVNPAPVIVTFVGPVFTPVFGETDTTTGIITPCVTVNFDASLVGEVPTMFATVK